MNAKDWEYLPYFLAVARAGSLRAGAVLLNANYGTVNRNILALESSYGTSLFTRSKRGFTLTEAGHSLLPIAEQTEISVVSARKQIEGHDKSESGVIRFSVTPMLAYEIIAPIIARFALKYPDIQVELHVTSNVENINRNETDISLRAADEVKDDVVGRKLYPLAIGAYASQQYIDTKFTQADPMGKELEWLGYEDDASDSKWLATSPYPQAKIRHMVTDGPMRLSLLRNHCGMSYIPVIFEKIFPDLCRVPNTEIRLAQPLWVLLHTDLRNTIRVRRFVDFLSDELMALCDDMQGTYI